MRYCIKFVVGTLLKAVTIMRQKTQSFESNESFLTILLMTFTLDLADLNINLHFPRQYLNIQ